MRIKGPVSLAFLIGTLMMIQFFVPHETSQRFYNKILEWLILLSIFMFFFALRSLVIFHLTRIKRRVEHWPYSFVTLGGMIGMALVGVFGKIGQDSLFQDLFHHLYVPMESTMFALLAFYIASAAFRAFRARTLEATLLLITATIVMIGRVPVGGESIHVLLSNWVEWIMTVPNTAAQRGILMGVGLGVIGTALKIVLGIERSYLGGGR